MQNGTVIKKNEKGFGFIKVDGAPEGAKDLFFHSNELQNISFDELQEGDKVSFEIGDSPRARTRSTLARSNEMKNPSAKADGFFIFIIYTVR